MSRRHHSKIQTGPSQHENPPRRAPGLAVFALMLVGISSLSYADSCVSESSKHRVAVLELYTSEGCNSCPPADRWLNSLRDRGYGANQLVPLAFHVDYWDYIGWPDRFAQARFSQRQRAAANRNNARVVYTPQFLLNGRDARKPWAAGRLTKDLQAINAQTARLKFRLKQNVQDNAVQISLNIDNDSAQHAQVYVVLYENGLNSEVRAGENAGKKLYHEHVVRDLSAPVVVSPGKAIARNFSFVLSSQNSAPRFGLAAIAEDANTGESIQAMAVDLCKG